MKGLFSHAPSRLPRRVAVLTMSLALSSPLFAQYTTERQDSCEVIIPKGYYETLRSGANRVSSHFDNPSKESVIKNTGKVYTFRLAACILPEYIKSDEGYGRFTDKDQVIAEVEKFWTQLETSLNSHFTEDVGIKFKVVHNQKLILFDYNVNGLVLDQYATDNTRLFKSKEIIDKALGADTTQYDLGILIGRPNNSRNGVAQLGSAFSPYLKGSAWVINNLTSIAHEIGHSFGAEHTHATNSISICTEPDKGRSIMSYGSPRDFFSLPSIYQMRSTLANMNYHTADGTVVTVNSSPTVTPLAEEEAGAQPLLDRQRIKTEYTITKGSNFQFYLPTTTGKKDSYRYNAHTFDISKNDTEHANTLRPPYKETKDSVVMYQPHYLNPSSLSQDQISQQNFVETGSDASATGSYTFLAAVHDNSRYDAMRVKLNIVDGNPFKISNVKFASWTSYDKSIGRDLSVTWEPCQQLYGKDSKVRILLSDDFGQTYKYVLADNVDNSGTWTGVLPYVKIGTVSYQDWMQQENGGRIKVEVVGEAAYDVYPQEEYSYQNGFVPKGFTLNPDNARINFKPKNSSDAMPEPQIHVNSLKELPKQVDLTAYRTTGSGEYPCSFKEEAEGCIVRRSWTANASGTIYTYTQTIVLPQTVSEQELVRASAQQLAAMAKPLYANLGQIGYPYEWLPAAKTFKAAYEKVFQNDDIVSDVTSADVEDLNEAMTVLSQIDDDEVAKPEDGVYYQVRSYLTPYNRDTYFYVVDDGQGEKLVSNTEFDKYSDAEKQNARWRCYIKDGKYHFVSDKGNAIFSPYVPQGGSLDYKLSDFQNFSNQGTERTLERGYTWGALTILNSQKYGCQVGLNGMFSVVRGVGNVAMTPDQRTNCVNGLIVSTDFQFLPTTSGSYNGIDSIPAAIGNNTKAATAVDGITYYTQEANGGVNVVFAKGKFTPADNGRVKLAIPSQLTVDNQAKTVVGIVAQQVTTKARYDNQFTYSLATAMGDYDFDLVIPATVTSIGDKALANCANLYEVSLAAGSQLTTIGAEAFSGSKNMRFAKTKLEADQLSAIGQKAFAGTALRRLVLSGKLAAMQANSFAGADKLEYLDLREAKGQATANRTTAGLPKHTLLFVNQADYTGETSEANVVRFNAGQGTCQLLALYDMESKDKGYAQHGISVPRYDNSEGTTDAPFTALKATFDRTFSSGFSTLCLPYDAAVPSGMTVYRFVSRSGSDGDYTYSFTSDNRIEANVPYLVQCTESGARIGEVSQASVKASTRYTIGDHFADGDAKEGFVGSLATLSHDDARGHDIYTLSASQQKWLRVTDQNGTINANAFVPPFRAFFTDPTINNAKTVDFTVDTSTAIESLPTEANRTATGVYTLDGRKVATDGRSLPKGIYIIGNKKVVIK